MPRKAMLLVADADQLAPGQRIWGTGGWQPPESREALDWLTLARLCGWQVSIASLAEGELVETGLRGVRDDGTHWIVLACNPNVQNARLADWLSERLHRERVVVVMRAPRGAGPLAELAGAVQCPDVVSGDHVSWIGAGSRVGWRCPNPVMMQGLDIDAWSEPLASLEGRTIIASRTYGLGAVLSLGFHPSQARDAAGCFSALLKHMLVHAAREPVATLDFDNTLVLRMDDPGGAQNVHSRDWYHSKLSEPDWSDITARLAARDARVSIAYVGGWVDDGDPMRGDLRVAGAAVERVAGQVLPSAQVCYTDRAGHGPGTIHDYESEFRGIEVLRHAARGDVELHGHTHMHPDTQAWAAAPDRYESTHWFRELGKPASATIAARDADQHPLAVGLQSLQRQFGAAPTTLVSPGDEWTESALERALDLGIRLVDSYYLALRYEGHLCWCQHVCAPYLDEAAPAWFAAGLPVVGYFHDRDLAMHGAAWLTACLDSWRDAGARRFIDFRELAGAVDRTLDFTVADGQAHLTVAGLDAVPLVRPLRLNLHVPRGNLPDQLDVLHQGRSITLPIRAPNGGRSGFVTLPV